MYNLYTPVHLIVLVQGLIDYAQNRNRLIISHKQYLLKAQSSHFISNLQLIRIILIRINTSRQI